jgi:ABC-type nitrate/sulfonate/bicarbonate transport system permease component
MAARSMRRLWVMLFRVGIIGGFLALWEIASGPWIEPFLISSPARIVSSLSS